MKDRRREALTIYVFTTAPAILAVMDTDLQWQFDTWHQALAWMGRVQRHLETIRIVPVTAT